MSSKKALRMLSPKVLEYPVKIFEVNVSENSEAKEGDILVRLSDHNGMPAAIAAPFDCRIGIVDVSAGETLESQSSLLELDRIEEVFAAEIVENEPEPEPELAPEPTKQHDTINAATFSEPASKPQSDADRIAALQAKYSKPNTRSASTVPKVTPDPTPPADPAPSQDPVQASPIEESRPQYQSEADRIAELQAKYASRSNGRQHTHSAPSTATEQGPEDNTESMELGKRLPFMLSLLIAPPLILFGILWLFGMLPTEMIDPPRRPSIFFLIQHPSIIFATLVGFGVPLLLYLNMPAPSDSKWSGKFRIANIIAGIIGFFATIAVAMTPTNDLLILLGVKDGILFEAKSKPASLTHTQSQSAQSQSAQSHTPSDIYYLSPDKSSLQFLSQFSWQNKPRITPTRYSTFPESQFPEFKKIDSIVRIGGHPKGATLIAYDRDTEDFYATIYDSKKKGLALTPQRLGQTKNFNFVISPKGSDQAVISIPDEKSPGSSYAASQFRVISTTRKPSKISLTPKIKDQNNGRVLASHNNHGLSARVRHNRSQTGFETVTIDVIKGNTVLSIPETHIGFRKIQNIYLEAQNAQEFSLAVIGEKQQNSQKFAQFRCDQKNGCLRIGTSSNSFAPGEFTHKAPDHYLHRGLGNVLHNASAMSFDGSQSSTNPDIVVGNAFGSFTEVNQYGVERQGGKSQSMDSAFIQKGNKVRYFPVRKDGRIYSKLIDVETLPNKSGYALLIAGKKQKNGESNWVVLVDNRMYPQKVWSNSNETYQDIMVTKSGHLIISGKRYNLVTKTYRPVFAELPY